VPEARQLLTDSVKKMTVQDAKGILTGGETSGTDYFKRTTRTQLHDRFLPIVKKSTAKVGVAQKYNEYAEQGAALGLVNKADANLDEYVTQKALDSLYLGFIRFTPFQLESAECGYFSNLWQEDLSEKCSPRWSSRSAPPSGSALTAGRLP
jgi:hypothetical protein